MRKLTVGDLFSGIGGFSKGLEDTGGFETKWFVEIDPFCQKVLAKHWPNVRRYGDVKEVHGVSAHAGCTRDERWRKAGNLLGSSGEIEREAYQRKWLRDTPCNADKHDICGKCLPPVDVLCGGPPCQAISVAGKRRGTEDDRWLWDEAIRLVGEIRPRWVIFENPTGLLSMQGGVLVNSVLSALEDEGYSNYTDAQGNKRIAPFIIPACSIGAPHRRDRVWVVAHHAERGRFAGRSGGFEAEPLRHGQNNGLSEQTDCHAADTWNTTPPRQQRDCGGLLREPESEGFGGSPWQEHWYSVAVRTCVRGMANGLPRQMDRNRVNRLKALGNSVVPGLVEILGRAILEAEDLYPLNGEVGDE